MGKVKVVVAGREYTLTSMQAGELVARVFNRLRVVPRVRIEIDTQFSAEVIRLIGELTERPTIRRRGS